MRDAVEASQSLWMATSRISRPGPLTADETADVCIVGAGIAGLSTAYQLSRSGLRVIVLDDGPISGGQTQRTTAHLASALDDRYYELEKIHGSEGMRLAAESHAAAIDCIESIVQAEGIDCDLSRLDGYLFLAPGASEDVLTSELDAAHRAGLTDVEWLPRAPLTLFDTGPCLRFPRQAQFHPLKYLEGLSAVIQQRGGRIFCDSHVSDIHAGTSPTVKTTAGASVRANAIVIATNTPINDLLVIHTKQAPYLTYAIGVSVPSGSVTKALYWDTGDAYHYIRIQSGAEGTDTLIVGGEDHKAGQADDQSERWDRLEAWTRERFPVAGEVQYRWSGMVMETTDGLAFLGPCPGQKNVYIATGDSGMGMTHGTIAGMLLSDLIQGRENKWAQLYDPSRKPVWGMAWKEFLSENANVASTYIKDWLGGSDVSSVDKISNGCGALVREGISMTAVYRDGHGHLHRRSAVCPHLGCVVHWNDAEKTWDCPCHGSRFDALGIVINGPANSDLADRDI